MNVHVKEQVFDPFAYREGCQVPTRCSVPATAVISVLQRVAEYQAQNVRFSESGPYLHVWADGWYFVLGLNRGDLDGLFECVTPRGGVLYLSDWSIEADPVDMLGDCTAWAVVDRWREEGGW
jgi:hypothetical protein